MKEHTRLGWLKFVYLYTIVGAGGTGLLMLVAPDALVQLLGMPPQDPYVYGVAASVWLAFGILSVLGFREPLRFLPVLLMQLCYKSVWLLAVVLPLMLDGQRPGYGYFFTAVMVSYVVLDLIAIPFSYVFGAGAKRESSDGLARGLHEPPATA